VYLEFETILRQFVACLFSQQTRLTNDFWYSIRRRLVFVFVPCMESQLSGIIGPLTRSPSPVFRKANAVMVFKNYLRTIAVSKGKFPGIFEDHHGILS